MSGSFAELLGDLFAPVGGVSLRRMFGGLGAFRDGRMFALVADDVLYFKVDGETEPRFRAEGSGPFVYTAMKGREVTMSYWRTPERLYDDPDEFREWTEAAIAVAQRGAAAKAGKPRKAKAQPVGARTGRRRKSGT